MDFIRMIIMGVIVGTIFFLVNRHKKNKDSKVIIYSKND